MTQPPEPSKTVEVIYPGQIRNLACDELGIAESTYYRAIYPIVVQLMHPMGIRGSLRAAPRDKVEQFIYRLKRLGLALAIKQTKGVELAPEDRD